MTAKVCDVCGAVATSMAVDMLRHEVPGQVWVEYSPIGPVKYGCAQHPAKSEEHLTHLPRQAEGKA